MPVSATCLLHQMEDYRQLARLSFEEFGDAFHVFVLGQISYAFHIAAKFGIKLVMFGENGEAEYAGDPTVIDRPLVPASDFQRLYFKGMSLKETVEFGNQNKSYFDIDPNSEDLSFYEPPSLETLMNAGIEGKHFFGYFKKWVPQWNYYYATEHTGFEANPERTQGTYSKYASLDDRLDGLHYYMKLIKFGFARATDDACHEIRDGHITREEGVALVKRYDAEFPDRYFKDFLQYIDITEDHFWSVVDGFRPEHVWKKEGNDWSCGTQSTDPLTRSQKITNSQT